MSTTRVEDADGITTVQDSTENNHPGSAKVAKFLASVENGDDNRSFTTEEEERVLRRIDLRILPLLLGAYFFQQLDKSALSYTSIFGLVEDTHLVGQQYSWLGSILYLSQLVFQPLAAVLLVKAPTGKVIGTAVLLWGSTLAITSACTDFKSLLGMRFLLGAFESMIGIGTFNKADKLKVLADPVLHCSTVLYCSDSDVVASTRADITRSNVEWNERPHVYCKSYVIDWNS